MDESLRISARTGNVSELYRLIQRDGNILRRFDVVEFTDTPLHIAAEAGCIGFAMEIMNLKPSFARKLNQHGLSPIHIAVKNGHKEMVLRFLEIDKDLVRVRGKKGETPLHYISKVGNRDGLLDTFLEVCPDCIRDVTTQNYTPLHISVKNKRLDVFQVLIRMLQKKDYYPEVMNRKDEDGNTALHIAAGNNQPQVLKLLLECKVDKHVANQDGLTALDLARKHNNKESINILRSCISPRVSNFHYKLKKQIVAYTTMTSSLFSYDYDTYNISGDDRNALLVILGLLLTATYQATLSPPMGVLPDKSSWISTNTNGDHDVGEMGISVMHQAIFLLFFIPTYIVFLVAFFLTLALLKPFPLGFRIALQENLYYETQLYRAQSMLNHRKAETDSFRGKPRGLTVEAMKSSRTGNK
ncbi:ankyrin repeat-containing protein BDA1-like [Hibiscus syriacus]|uniref:ankyrin repeat-containing protein BDA1-like n=1 Tax=Hibiscus syriacus TaxID=106335 RepID=UPI00192481B8|nr:ankyrin repeat-containing protein BDA1-like [Hibiscus syriacus]